MKNNPYIIVLAIVIGFAMGAYIPNSTIVYILASILRGIR